jgi:hypothetical protein
MSEHTPNDTGLTAWPLLDDLGVLYTRCPNCDERIDLPETAGEAFNLINAHECAIETPNLWDGDLINAHECEANR